MQRSSMENASKWLSFLVATAAIAAMFGCGPAKAQNPAPGEPMELAFWNGFSGPDGKAMEQIVKQFNAEHPRIHVKMQIIPWGTYYDKVTLGLAFGGAPDVFILHANRVPEFASHDALNRLDDLVASDKLDSADFVPKAWNAGIWQGKRFALPLDCHPVGMYYNVDLFKKAGIDHPPTTMAEFLDDAHRLTKDTDGDGKTDQWGYAMTDIHLVSTTFLDQFGGGVLTPDMKASALDSPASLQAVETLLGFSDKEKISNPPSGDDGWRGFQTGKVGMVFQGIWMIDSLEQQKGLNYAAAPVPFFGPVHTVQASSHCMSMPAALKGARREAAWSFMRYLSDHSLTWAKGGQVPVRLSILHSTGFQDLRVQREFAKQLDYVQYEPFSTVINQISGFADSAIDASLNHVDKPETLLKDAARRVNNVLRRQ
ncbi:ABC transporter substrate-binding protein [Fimbriimonas ginsengisoli]|nr:ABC transporter substrate-binding protein [Fimbriimonas ginsengisoli]